MPLQDTINADLKSAMLAKDGVRVRGLRAIKSALLLASTEKGASTALTEEAEVKVLQKLVKQRKESADIYKQQLRDDLYKIEIEEQEVIEAYLPKQMGKEELKAGIEEIVVQIGATGIKDMGKVMGVANKTFSGRADGKTISEMVKEALTK